MNHKKEYIEKSTLLSWLCKTREAYENCAEKTSVFQSKKRLAFISSADAYRDVTEKILFGMDTFSINGETSDGYHTFDELYRHRAVLFSVIVGLFPELSWKSKLHADGTMYKDMFIVGIDTPAGQATYHYDISPYWDIFHCKELERAPEWDGHTPEDALKRISMLRGYANLVRNGGNHEKV